MTLIAEGVGLVEPPPVNGALPGGQSFVPGRAGVTINGIPSSSVTAFLAPDQIGKYWIDFAVPTELAPGSADIRLRVNGVNSNVFVAYFN